MKTLDQLRLLAKQNRAQVKQHSYALITIKSIDDDARVIEGIATTPTPDRVGDIVEPDGAEYKLPIPLLWQHDSWQPIGWVEKAKVTADGISITARFVQIEEDSDLKRRLDDAWLAVKSGLVRGLSIGFKPLESARIGETWSERFLKWLWLELSCVSIPANQEATITAVKSLDKPWLAASGAKSKQVVRLGSSPGDSGTSKIIEKGTDMTVKERIAQFEAKRAANMARLTEIMNKSAEDGSTLDASQQEEYDTLHSEVKSIDEHLVRLKDHEKMLAASATPIEKAAGTDQDLGSRSRETHRGNQPLISVRSNLPPGVKMARYAMAMLRGKGDPQRALTAVENDQVWMRSTPELATVLKAAVAAGDTTTPGWASELVYADNLATEFIEYLRPKTILGKIPNFRRVPFNIRVGGMNSGLTGYWVGQGQPIPASKGGTTAVSLAIAKAAGLCAIDNELARLSTPSAEIMVRDDLAGAVIQLLDDSFINPNNGGVTNVSPASMTYGVTPITPSGTTYAALRLDLQNMMEVALDANLDTEGSVWIMSSTLALKLSMMVNALDAKVNPDLSVNGGTFMGMPAIVSQAAQIAGSPQYNDILIWLHPREVFLADDGQVAIEASKEASIQLLDNPTNASTGATTPTTLVSMFQTESMAIKAVRYINWVKRRSVAAQWIQAAAYF